MKRVIIGDIHGCFDMFMKIIDDEHPDQVIVLGDYFDSFNIKLDEQVVCFDKICELAKQYNNIKHKFPNNDAFVLIIGNHDFHYLNDVDEHYSGFNPALKDIIADKLRDMIKSGDMLFVYEDKVNKTLFTHAGVSQIWLENNFDSRLDNYLHMQNDFAFIGGALKMRYMFNDDYVYELTQKVNEYYTKFIEAHKFVGASMTGNDVKSSPLWIRPDALKKSAVIGYDQIFGHTHDVKLKEYHLSDNKHLYNLDCIDYNNKHFASYICEMLDDDTKKLIYRKKCSIQTN